MKEEKYFNCEVSNSSLTNSMLKKKRRECSVEEVPSFITENLLTSSIVNYGDDLHVCKPKLPVHTDTQVPKSRRRRSKTKINETSLGTLAVNFVNLLRSCQNKMGIDLNCAALSLHVAKRRLYDVTNVLEGIQVVEKTKKNHIALVQRKMKTFHPTSQQKINVIHALDICLQKVTRTFYTRVAEETFLEHRDLALVLDNMSEWYIVSNIVDNYVSYSPSQMEKTLMISDAANIKAYHVSRQDIVELELPLFDKERRFHQLSPHAIRSYYERELYSMQPNPIDFGSRNVPFIPLDNYKEELCPLKEVSRVMNSVSNKTEEVTCGFPLQAFMHPFFKDENTPFFH